MIVTCAEMKEIEERAFAKGITAEALMDQAGSRIAAAVQQFFPTPAHCLVVYGKGHNGGDALVAALHLFNAGWEIALKGAFPPDILAPLTFEKLEAFIFAMPLPEEDLPLPPPPIVILDGLLGIGAKPGLREPLRSATREINELRQKTGAAVFAMDIPTGLDGDTGEADADTVIADFTITVGFAKRGLLADTATDFVGRLAVIPLQDLTNVVTETPALEDVATPHSLAGLRAPRSFSTHKGDCGRVGIIAGSRGFTGAAIMAANSAVRAGAGLVSLFVTADIYPLIAGAVMPEVMCAPIDCYLDVLDRHLDVLAIGPGLGREDASDLLDVIERFQGPMVVDADALNLVSKSMDILQRCTGPRLLTPHPGEMKRLFPQAGELLRHETVERFLDGYPGRDLTLLLKGSRTIIAQRTKDGLRVSYNSTGNPGMATGGMGDVLTGTTAALAGQKLPLFDAARVGAWVCGRAAELAISHGGRSEESLSATDLWDFFGDAFKELRGQDGC